MATTKDITMKQFNGTDYDTLYPKTKVEQVENLTPSSIGAVAKSGDTMTGELKIENVSYPEISFVHSGNNNTASLFIGGHNFQIKKRNVAFDDTNYRRLVLSDSVGGPLNSALEIGDSINGVEKFYTVLHTGNAQSLGFSKIATGSYVGTGNCGPNYPMSINVGFTPKFFWIGLYEYTRVQDGVTMEVMMDTGRKATNGLFIYPATRFLSSPNQNLDYYVTVTWGSTMSWYGFLDDPTKYGEYQFNKAGVTYYWVAIG